ncbi:hypothetical protein M405DRAFT_824011, partial [Rhizopogon salebrosus TDB-379]
MSFQTGITLLFIAGLSLPSSILVNPPYQCTRDNQSLRQTDQLDMIIRYYFFPTNTPPGGLQSFIFPMPMLFGLDLLLL